MRLSVLYMLLNTLFVALTATMGKLASTEASALQLTAMQGSLGLLIVSPLILFKGGFSAFKTARLPLHLLRDVAGCTWTLCFFLALPYLTLINTQLMINTGPMIIPVMLWMWLKVRVPTMQWIGIGLGFIGVLFVLQPTSALFHPMMLCALVPGFCTALIVIVVGRLSATESSLTILFYLCAVTATLTLPVALFCWQALSIQTWALIGLMVSFWTAGQFFFNLALKSAKPAAIAPLLYLVLVWSSLIDWALFHTTPSLATLLGGLLIWLACTLSIQARRSEA